MICCIAVSLLCSYYGMTKITVIQFTIDDKKTRAATARAALPYPHLFDVIS